MTADPAIAPLAWAVRPQDVPLSGLPVHREADAGERSGVARALELIDCGAIILDVMVKPLAGGRFRARGKVRAAVQQACVVTLEPVAADLEEPLDIEFRPSADMPEAGDRALDFEADSDVEAIEQEGMPLGRIAFELIASAIDPYPRAPGAVFDWTDVTAGDKPAAGRPNPFAALAKLKKGG